MTITSSTEGISDGGENDNNSRNNDGAIPTQDATKGVVSGASRVSESESTCFSSSSSSLSPSVMNGVRSQREGSAPVPERKVEDSRSPSDWKRKGNVYFGKEDWDQALDAYRSGLSALLRQKQSSQKESTPSEASVSNRKSSPGVSPAVDPVEVALRSNTAFVLLKLHQYSQAEEECDHLLLACPLNAKGKMLISYIFVVDAIHAA